MSKNIFLLILFFFVGDIKAIIIGSFSAPSIQSTAVFPASGNANNEMRGFAKFANGFTLSSAQTSCLFTSYFPVNGAIDMRGGTLSLATDLFFNLPLSFVSTGSFIGNSYTIHLPEQISSYTLLSTQTCLSLIATQTQTAAVNTVDFSYDNQYIAAGLNQAGGNNLVIYKFDGTNLIAQTSISFTTAVNSIRWHPSTYYLSIGIAAAGTANHVFVYQYNPVANTLTLGPGTQPYSTGSNVNAVAWSVNGNYFLYGTDVAFHVVTFNSGTGATADLGINNTNTTQRNAADWEPNNNFFVIGYAVSPQLIVYSFNGSTAAVQLSSAIGNTVSAVACAPFGGYIAVGLSGGTDNLKIFQHSVAANTLTDLGLALGETDNVLSLDWATTGSVLVVGLALSSGETELRTYEFNSTTNKLTLLCQFNTGSSINAARFSPNTGMIVTGDSLSNLAVYSSSSNGFIFSNSNLVLNSDIVSNVPISFVGSCAIEGNNFAWDLSNANTYFTITSGANLVLRNLTLKGISGNAISCVDNTGVITLQNVQLIQNGSYSFSNGSLIIGTGETLITGTSTFIYSSIQTSTINSHATLMFDNLMTFSYAPSNLSNSLIAFTDITSNLYLLNTTLYCGTSGLQLTKGTVYVDGPCNVFSSATSNAQAIKFGDGLSSSNNINLQVLAESGFNLQTGYLLFQNL